MASYVNDGAGTRRPCPEYWLVAIGVALVALLLWAFWTPPVSAQPGDPIPDPGEGNVWRFQQDPLPEWIVIMQEAIALRQTTLDEFTALGVAQAEAAIAAAQTDAELAAAMLSLRGYEIIDRSLEGIAYRSDVRSPEVGYELLKRIEIGAHGVFTTAERVALAQAALEYAQSVIAAEAAAQAAIWNSMATAEIDVPSDLGEPVEEPGE